MLIATLYINNEKLNFTLKIHHHFHQNQKLGCLGINKYVQDIYKEKYNTVEIEEDINKARDLPCSQIGNSGEGNGIPLQYSCLENPMDGGAWQAAVHGVAKSQTRLSDFIFHFHELEKEMAIHCSVLAWRIQGTGEPGGLLSMGSHRVGHD